MNKMMFLRIYFILIFLVILNVYAQETPEDSNKIIQFEPLADNEKFAYMIVQNRHRTMQLYARNEQLLKQYRLIGEWQGVEEWSGLQFSKDRKKCFFLINERPSYNDALYMADGQKGTVEYIRHVPYAYRTSFDGDLLIFENIDYSEQDESNITLYEGKEPRFTYRFDRKEGQFILYDIKTRTVINSFIMTVKHSIEGNGGYFNLTRDETGNFRVTYSVEGGSIIAFAIIDPILEEIKMIWDNTDNLSIAFPNSIDEEWRDDIQNQWKDTFLKIK